MGPSHDRTGRQPAPRADLVVGDPAASAAPRVSSEASPTVDLPLWLAVSDHCIAGSHHLPLEPDVETQPISGGRCRLGCPRCTRRGSAPDDTGLLEDLDRGAAGSADRRSPIRSPKRNAPAWSVGPRDSATDLSSRWRRSPVTLIAVGRDQCSCSGTPRFGRGRSRDDQVG